MGSGRVESAHRSPPSAATAMKPALQSKARSTSCPCHGWTWTPSRGQSCGVRLKNFLWIQLTSHIRQWDQIIYKSITGSVIHEKHLNTKHLKTTTTQHQLWVNYGNATACSLSSIQQKIMSNYLGHRHHQIRTLCGLRSSTVRLDTLSIACPFSPHA